MAEYEHQRVLEVDGGDVTFKLREPQMDVPPPKDVSPTEWRRGPALIAKAENWEGVLEHPASRADIDEYPKGELLSLYRNARR